MCSLLLCRNRVWDGERCQINVCQQVTLDSNRVGPGNVKFVPDLNEYDAGCLTIAANNLL